MTNEVIPAVVSPNVIIAPSSSGNVTGPGTGYTLCQMIQAVRTFTRDEGGVFVSDDDIIGWLNRGLSLVGWRTRDVVLFEHGTLTGGSFQIPFDKLPRYIAMKHMRMQVPADVDPTLPFITVQWVDDIQFDDWRAQQTTMGDPARDPLDPPHVLGRVFAGHIEVFPVPRTDTEWDAAYFATPLPLTTCTGTVGDTTDLRPELQENVIAFACAQAALKLQQYIMTEMFEQKYEAGLPPPDIQEKQMPGPIQLSMTRGPFDTSDARHN